MTEATFRDQEYAARVVARMRRETQPWSNGELNAAYDLVMRVVDGRGCPDLPDTWCVRCVRALGCVVATADVQRELREGR